MFFSSKPCLSFDEKARIEFLLQLLAEHLGTDRVKRPVLDPEDAFFVSGKPKESTDIVLHVGEYLGHDTRGISLEVSPQLLNVKSSGG